MSLYIYPRILWSKKFHMVEKIEKYFYYLYANVFAVLLSNTMEPPIKIDKQKEEIKKRRINQLSIIVSMVEQNFKRQSAYKDPVTKNCIFLEKLLIMTDIIKGAMFSHYEDVPEELHTRINNLVEIMNTNISTLIDMIQQPVFSPDHPYGSAVMDTAKNDFKEKV